MMADVEELDPAAKMAASKRKGKHLNDDKRYIRKDINETIYPGLSGHDFSFGDIAWVKSGTYSWWPAQVVDEKRVGKPRKKAEGGVLVRLYGTHNYVCIDPVKNNEEFENMMKQNNSNIREMFEEALKEDLSRIKNHRKIKGNPPSTEEHVSAGASTDVEMWDRIERNEDTDLVNCVGASSVKDKRGTRCSKNVDKASNFAPGNKKLKENIDRRQPVTGKSRTLENLHGNEVEGEVSVQTGCEARQNGDGKPTTKQQDLAKLEQDEVKEGKAKEKGIQEKKRKLAGKTRSEAINDDCERGSKRDASEHYVYKSVQHSEVGKTPDAGARRMKVMQTLALIAPSGSPFGKKMVM